MSVDDGPPFRHTVRNLAVGDAKFLDVFSTSCFDAQGAIPSNRYLVVLRSTEASLELAGARVP